MPFVELFFPINSIPMLSNLKSKTQFMYGWVADYDRLNFPRYR